MIGVKTSMSKAASEVIVNVDPVRSLTESFLFLDRVAIKRSCCANESKSFESAFFITGTTNPSSTETATPIFTDSMTFNPSSSNMAFIRGCSLSEIAVAPTIKSKSTGLMW